MEVKISLIRDDNELEQFVEYYCKFAGTELIPMDAFDDSEVYVAKNEKEEMIGGFEIARHPHMAWFGAKPEGQVWQKEIDFDQSAELNLTWILPELRKTRVALQLWSKIAEVVLASDLKYITFAVDSRKPRLKKFYKKIISGTIYEGPLTFERVPHGAVYFSRRWKFHLIFLFYLKEWIGRTLSDFAQPFIKRFKGTL